MKTKTYELTSSDHDQIEQARKLAGQITDFINSFSDKHGFFNLAMSREHRTLQQSFTKLCLAWLEHVASSEYEFDPRNQQSKEVAQILLQLWREHQQRMGYTGSTLDFVSKPSSHLGII